MSSDFCFSFEVTGSTNQSETYYPSPAIYMLEKAIHQRTATSNTNLLVAKLNQCFKENPTWRNKEFMLVLVYSNQRFDSISVNGSFYNHHRSVHYYAWFKNTSAEELHRRPLSTNPSTEYLGYRPYFGNASRKPTSGAGEMNQIVRVMSNSTSEWVPLYPNVVSSGVGYHTYDIYNMQWGTSMSDLSTAFLPINSSITTFESFLTYLETFPVRNGAGQIVVNATTGTNTNPHLLISAVVYRPTALLDELITKDLTVSVGGTKNVKTAVQYFKGDPFVIPSSVTPIEIPVPGLVNLPEYDTDRETPEGAFNLAASGVDILKIAHENPQAFLEHGLQLIQASSYANTRSFR